MRLILCGRCLSMVGKPISVSILLVCDGHYPSGEVSNPGATEGSRVTVLPRGLVATGVAP
jgi:hypothetical protein